MTYSIDVRRKVPTTKEQENLSCEAAGPAVRVSKAGVAHWHGRPRRGHGRRSVEELFADGSL